MKDNRVEKPGSPSTEMPARRRHTQDLGTNARHLAWRPSPAASRVYLKDLGAADGCTMQLVRYEAGGRLGITIERGPAFLYVLDGELIHRNRRLWPGAAEVIRRDSGAADSHTEIGCTFLLVCWEDGAKRA